jgi:hypothetical protein
LDLFYGLDLLLGDLLQFAGFALDACAEGEVGGLGEKAGFVLGFFCMLFVVDLFL